MKHAYRRRMRILPVAAALVAPLLAPAPLAAGPAAAPGLATERVVLLVRHGVRAPIDGEAPAGTRAARGWPRWPVAAEQLTPHGAAALRIAAAHDRRWLDKTGVLKAGHCPAPDQVRIWTNTAGRTIASGAALAEGLAPDCALAVAHQPAGTADPLFEPLRAGVAPFDPAKAIASIEAYTGGVATLATRHRADIAALDTLLGCGDPAGCSPSPPSTVQPSADGKGIDLTGPIRITSGTAQVLLLQYAEGLDGPSGRWPAGTPAALARVGALHAALFDVFTRPPYMAARQAGPLVRLILDRFTRTEGPKVDLLVGHDTNVTALAAALGVTLRAPGYADGDVAPGGTLALALLRDGRGARFVRVDYRTQTPEALRRLRADQDVTRLIIPDCHDGPAQSCPIERFVTLLRARIAE